MHSPTVTDPADVDYVKGEFFTIDQLISQAIEQGTWPGPSYVLPDGTQYFPADYFEQERNREAFLARFFRECERLGVPYTVAIAEDVWREFLSGVYSVCLRTVTPENIAKKIALISSIERLVECPQRENAEWGRQLQRAVDDLDELERPFSPVLDRTAFDTSPTRDRFIRDVRRKFPELAWRAADS